jgi:hypothetical protein
VSINSISAFSFDLVARYAFDIEFQNTIKIVRFAEIVSTVVFLRLPTDFIQECMVSALEQLSVTNVLDFYWCLQDFELFKKEVEQKIWIEILSHPSEILDFLSQKRRCLMRASFRLMNSDYFKVE